MRKRSVVIAGHRTSISLEEQFWHALRAVAAERGSSINRLIATIDAERPAEYPGNLSFDLANWRVHAELALRPLVPPAAPPVTLTVEGPPDKASVNTDLGALEAYLAAHRAAAPAP